MAINLSVPVRNAMLDAIETTIGTTPKLRILTGTKPANCAAAQTGTLLAEMTLPADFMANASAGVKGLSGSWSVAVTTAGTAGHYRIVDSTGTTCHEQGNIGTSGQDMNMTSVTLTVGQVAVVTSKNMTAPNA